LEKDLVIGAASGYNWDKLKYWVNSIKRTGFSGDVIVVATDISGDTVRTLVQKGVLVYGYDEPTKDGGFEREGNSKMAPHTERFFYIWNHLQENPDKYRYVITTDTRDVIFQTNPSEYLSSNQLSDASWMDGTGMLAATEGLKYDHEPWGRQNFKEGYGPFFYDMIMKDRVIANVGVIAGFSKYIQDFLLMLFQMTLHRPSRIIDQAAYNFLLSMEPYRSSTAFCSGNIPWAAQLGTTEKAVEAGAGDLGRNPEGYNRNYLDPQPIIEGHEVYTGNYEKYCIVHQYDRIPLLKKEIEDRYGI